MDTKAELRAKIKAQLHALNAGEHELRSAAACQRLIEHNAFKNARTLFAYASIRNEPATQAVLSTALQNGKRLALPRADTSGTLTFHAVNDLVHDLAPGRFGILEPLPDCTAIPAEEADLLLVPGIAFTDRGDRLGQGGGYYDRYLAQPALRAQLCAIAFDFQILASLPTEPHDRHVPLLFTDSRTITT